MYLQSIGDLDLCDSIDEGLRLFELQGYTRDSVQALQLYDVEPSLFHAAELATQWKRLPRGDKLCLFQDVDQRDMRLHLRDLRHHRYLRNSFLSYRAMLTDMHMLSYGIEMGISS